jgi:hypothetical protein
MGYKRMTAKQREVYAALRMMDVMAVLPEDARPLHALKRRGLVRFFRREGVKHAALRLTVAEVRVRRRYGWRGATWVPLRGKPVRPL